MSPKADHHIPQKRKSTHTKKKGKKKKKKKKVLLARCNVDFKDEKGKESNFLLLKCRFKNRSTTTKTQTNKTIEKV